MSRLGIPASSKTASDRLSALGGSVRSRLIETIERVETALPPVVLRLLPIIGGLGLILLGLTLRAHPLSVLTHVVILAIFGVAYDLLFGYTGLLSFGHAAFFGVGSYIGIYGTAEMEQSFVVLLVAAVLIGLVLSLVIGVISLRTSGVYFAMLTLALAQLLYFLTIRFDEVGGASGLSTFLRPEMQLPLLDLNDNFHFYVLCVVVLVATYLIIRRILSSPMGDVFRAIRENEERARMIGYNTFYYKLASLSVSGIFSTIAGVLFGLFLYFASPQFLYWQMSGEVLLLTLFGGAGTLIGPIFGSFFIVLIEEFLSPITDNWRLFVGISFVAVVILFPRGIVGLVTEEE